MQKSSGTVKNLSGKGLKIGIVAGRFNYDITAKLLEGAEKTLRDKGAASVAVWVPGAFEIPLLLQKMAKSRKFDGLIALGAVVRGETPHFDYVAGEAARGVMRVSLDEKIPIAFGVLTTNNLAQALDRVGGRHGHKGEEAALTVIEMIGLLQEKGK
jgi:6,7-dimethyl-8-ribityllumazine synthase